MDFEKLWETLIFRDALEYTLPGGLLTLAFALLADASAFMLDHTPPFAFVLSTINVWQVVAFIAVSYVAGHILTSLDSLFRIDENKLTNELLFKDGGNNSIKRIWLGDKVIEVLAQYLGISGTSLETDLKAELRANSQKESKQKKSKQNKSKQKEPKAATTIRELSRSIIHKNQQELYREFVNRHSIMSRFLMNMMWALGALLLSLGFLAASLWQCVVMAFTQHRVFFGLVTFIVVLCLGGTIWLFRSRSRRLRETMIKHTFEILYVDYILSKDKH